MKDEISEDILKAIRQVFTGQPYMSGKLLKNLLKKESNGLLVDKD